MTLMGDKSLTQIWVHVQKKKTYVYYDYMENIVVVSLGNFVQ